MIATNCPPVPFPPLSVMIAVVIYPTPGSTMVIPVMRPDPFISTVTTAGLTQSPVIVATGATVYPEPASDTMAPTTESV